MTQILQGDELLQRFVALDIFLVQHHALWHPRPFKHLELAWECKHPDLADWLKQRSLDQAEAAQHAPTQLAAPAPYPLLACQAAELSLLGELPSAPLPPAPSRLEVHVPGRKWQQIEAFASRLEFLTTAEHWLDWCAGKGHLGRRLMQHGQRLTCLEYDPALILAGQALSDRHRLIAAHVCQDVLAPAAAKHLTEAHSPVALHACGDLHVRLLQLASEARCANIAIAPCCYNRIAGLRYTPLSQAAKSSALSLDLDDLALPASEAVTAGTRTRRQRDQSMARRLGFDLMQRQLRQTDEYLPTPSLPAAWLQKPFADYCTDLAVLKNLPPPGEQPWAALEQAGEQRLAQVRNLELLRNLFRRPIELWLALDRALLIQEQGYRVKVGTFCAHELTPRNVMIHAERL